MRRRDVLACLAVGAAAGCSNIESRVTEAVSNDEPDGDFAEFEWHDEHTWLDVYFDESHDSEALWLTHEADDTILWIDGAPRFEGPVSVPVLDAIACDDANYPSANFELVAAEGRPLPGIGDDITAREPLELPAGYLDRLPESEYYEGSEAEVYCMGIEKGHHPDA